MDNKINWTYVGLAIEHRIKQLEDKVSICLNCEEYTKDLDAVKKELKTYKEEYKKVLIEQQKSNK